MTKPMMLLSEETIAARVKELGAQIARDYAGEELAVVPILAGSFVFAADLVRAIDLPLSVDFLGVRSYGDATKTSGVVRIMHDLLRPIDGKHVLFVEDIVDTGLTVRFLMDAFKSRSPRSLKLCSLLHKPARARVDVPIDYLGFTIEDVFVVGYGLDAAQKYRNLPYIGIHTDD
ncbi:MAG TPA: hypoxanthine phosphoribosyltransferase [Polyangiales bacterium]|nr:hypoxanthine phosphoribosyltransferase [Polyangiales bacterium]